MSLCILCNDIPQPIHAIRKKAMQVKRKLDKAQLGWRESFFEDFPDLLAPSDEEDGDGGVVVSVGMKRKQLSLLVPSKRTKTVSAAVGINPDKDGETFADGVGIGGKDKGPDVDEVTFLQEVPAPVDGRVKSMESMLIQMKKQIADLKSANAIREQQELADDEEEVRTRFSHVEKRTQFFEVLKECHPSLSFPVPVEVDEDQEYFSSFRAKLERCQMPFCPPLLEHLSLVSKPSVQGTRKEPFKLIDRFYKAVSDVEQSILKPRFVPAPLLAEVDNKFKQNVGASGEEARLKRESANGQKELASLRDLKQASSALRLVNNQELGVQTVSKLATLLSADVQGLLAIEGKPAGYDEMFQLMNIRVNSILTCVRDLKASNTYMAKGVIHQYVDAVKERRSAWIASSKLPPALQAELSNR
jgi:hypothetical protein